MTEVSASDDRPIDAGQIEHAARQLRAGGLVAFPTETVYGLGADAENRAAVAGVYRTKGRPAGHPLIVHVTGIEQARWWADWPPLAQQLAEAFWPGPLSLVLVRRADAPAWACGSGSTIGLRCPSHPVARSLLAAFARLGGHGVAAPSANRFGRVSPTTARHVRDDLGDEVSTLLDGGACPVGVESTIVDLSRGSPVLLRPGGIRAADIAALTGMAPLARDAAAPPASGTLQAHYAPHTPLDLIEAAAVADICRRSVDDNVPIAIWARSRPDEPGRNHWEPASADPAEYARLLYDTLRRLDQQGFARIIVEHPPRTPAWAAVIDRLQRAAAHHRIQP